MGLFSRKKTHQPAPQQPPPKASPTASTPRPPPPELRRTTSRLTLGSSTGGGSSSTTGSAVPPLGFPRTASSSASFLASPGRPVPRLFRRSPSRLDDSDGYDYDEPPRSSSSYFGEGGPSSPTLSSPLRTPSSPPVGAAYQEQHLQTHTPVSRRESLAFVLPALSLSPPALDPLNLELCGLGNGDNDDRRPSTTTFWTLDDMSSPSSFFATATSSPSTPAADEAAGPGVFGPTRGNNNSPSPSSTGSPSLAPRPDGGPTLSLRDEHSTSPDDVLPSLLGSSAGPNLPATSLGLHHHQPYECTTMSTPPPQAARPSPLPRLTLDPPTPARRTAAPVSRPTVDVHHRSTSSSLATVEGWKIVDSPIAEVSSPASPSAPAAMSALPRPPSRSSSPPLPKANGSSGGRKRFLGMWGQSGTGSKESLHDHRPRPASPEQEPLRPPAAPGMFRQNTGGSTASLPEHAMTTSASSSFTNDHSPVSNSSNLGVVAATSTARTPLAPTRPAHVARPSSSFFKLGLPSSKKSPAVSQDPPRPPSPADSFRVISARHVTSSGTLNSDLEPLHIPTSAGAASPGASATASLTSSPVLGNGSNSGSTPTKRPGKPIRGMSASTSGGGGGNGSDWRTEAESAIDDEEDDEGNTEEIMVGGEETSTKKVSVAAFRRRRSSATALAGGNGSASELPDLARDSSEQQQQQEPLSSSAAGGGAVPRSNRGFVVASRQPRQSSESAAASPTAARPQSSYLWQTSSPSGAGDPRRFSSPPQSPTETISPAVSSTNLAPTRPPRALSRPVGQPLSDSGSPPTPTAPPLPMAAAVSELAPHARRPSTSFLSTASELHQPPQASFLGTNGARSSSRNANYHHSSASPALAQPLAGSAGPGGAPPRTISRYEAAKALKPASVPAAPTKKQAAAATSGRHYSSTEDESDSSDGDDGDSDDEKGDFSSGDGKRGRVSESTLAKPVAVGPGAGIARPSSRSSFSSSQTLNAIASSAAVAHYPSRRPVQAPLISAPTGLVQPVLDRRVSVRRSSVSDLVDRPAGVLAAQREQFQQQAASVAANKQQQRPMAPPQQQQRLRLRTTSEATMRGGRASAQARDESEEDESESDEESDDYGRDRSPSAVQKALPPAPSAPAVKAAAAATPLTVDTDDSEDDRPLGISLAQRHPPRSAPIPVSPHKDRSALAAHALPAIPPTTSAPLASAATAAPVNGRSASSSASTSTTASSSSSSSVSSSTSSSSISLGGGANGRKPIGRMTSHQQLRPRLPSNNSLGPRPTSHVLTSMTLAAAPAAFSPPLQPAPLAGSSSASSMTGGDSSSGRTPITPRESLEVARTGGGVGGGGNDGRRRVDEKDGRDDNEDDEEAAREKRTKERRKIEALNAIELGHVQHGPAPDVGDDDGDEATTDDYETREGGDRFAEEQPRTLPHHLHPSQASSGPGSGFFQSPPPSLYGAAGFPPSSSPYSPYDQQQMPFLGGGFPSPSPMAGPFGFAGPAAAADPGAMWAYMQAQQAQLAAMQMQMQMQMHQQQAQRLLSPEEMRSSMMAAKQQFQAMMAAQAAQLAGDQWETASTMGGPGGGGRGGGGMSDAGSVYGVPPSGAASMYGGLFGGGGAGYAASAYGGGGGGSQWGGSEAGGGYSRSEYGGGAMGTGGRSGHRHVSSPLDYGSSSAMGGAAGRMRSGSFGGEPRPPLHSYTEHSSMATDYYQQSPIHSSQLPRSQQAGPAVTALRQRMSSAPSFASNQHHHSAQQRHHQPSSSSSTRPSLQGTSTSSSTASPAVTSTRKRAPSISSNAELIAPPQPPFARERSGSGSRSSVRSASPALGPPPTSWRANQGSISPDPKPSSGRRR